MVNTKNYTEELTIIGNQKNEERLFWESVFADNFEIAKFPTDKRKGIKAETEMGIYSFSFPDDLCSNLEKLSKGSEYTLHIILTAGINLLLYKYTGIKDIVIGTPIYMQEIEGKLCNKMIPLRNRFISDITFKSLLKLVRENLIEVINNQSFPIEIIQDMVNSKFSLELTSLFDVIVMISNIHDKNFINNSNHSILFTFTVDTGNIYANIEYKTDLYSQEYIGQISRHLTNLLSIISNDIERKLLDISILTDSEINLLTNGFNNTSVPYTDDRTVSELFETQVASSPDSTAIIHNGDNISYKQLNNDANQIGWYLIENKKIVNEECIGIVMDRSIQCITAILAIIKAGGSYIPINPELPEERIKNIVESSGIRIIVSQSKYILLLNRLQWEIDSLDTFVCLDSESILDEEEVEESGLMDKKLWEYVGESAIDDITGGGWFSSYTDLPFSKEEMDEYSNNILVKLSPYLSKETRILEVGCASGLSMFKLVSHVALYYGTDLSKVIIEKNQKRVDSENISNLTLECLAADEINSIGEENFNIAIINSVIQDFHGFNYLRKVIKQFVSKLSDKGIIFIGDVMDQDKKSLLIEDLVNFKESNDNEKYRTKTNWDLELFVPKRFFEDLHFEIPEISTINFSNKIHTIKNELTEFRYDVIICIDKTKCNKLDDKKKYKHQADASVIRQYGTDNVICKGNRKITPDNLAYIIFTSGSTGKPKGAMIEHRGMINHVEAKINDLNITGNSIIAQNASLYFDISVWQYFSALLKGAVSVIYNNKDILNPTDFIEQIVKDKISILEVVPSYLSVLLDSLELRKVKFTHLKYLLVTGEVIKPELVRKWIGQYPDIQLVNAYGPTEASDDITHYFMKEQPDSERIPIGKTVQNFRISIVDEDMQLTPPGIKGEICVSGIGVGRGYINDKSKTQQSFLEISPFVKEQNVRMYKTGDIGCWLKDGNLDYFGRKDYQVKIRGFRIELEEIEVILYKHNAIKEALVIDYEDSNKNKILCAYIELYDKKFDIVDTEIIEWLERELPDYMIPSFIIRIDSLPLSTNGKLDRNALPKPETFFNKNNIVKPANQLEEALASIWADVLGINKNLINTTDNFFKLGGNSISILKIAYRITKELGINISMGDLFLKQTIQDLAPVLQEENLMDDMNCLVKLNNCIAEKNIFLIHTADGTVFGYKGLAQLLENEYNVYGIQAHGLCTETHLPRTAEEMVAEYYKEIKQIQPEGSYIIGGHCIGTFISYELLRMMEDKGYKKNVLLVLDVPAFILPDYIKLYKSRSKSILFRQKLLPFLFPKEKDKFFKEVKKEKTLEGNDEIPLVETHDEWKKIVEKNIDTLINREYSPTRIIKSNALVISAIDSNIERLTLKDWENMTFGKVDYLKTTGNHDSMFYPPHVNQLVKNIREIKKI